MNVKKLDFFTHYLIQIPSISEKIPMHWPLYQISDAKKKMDQIIISLMNVIL